MAHPPQGAVDVSGAHFCGQSCDSESPCVVIKRSKLNVVCGPTCHERGHQTQTAVCVCLGYFVHLGIDYTRINTKQAYTCSCYV